MTTPTVELIVDELLTGEMAGSCHGCSNIGHDTLRHLAEKYPEIKKLIRAKGYTDNEQTYDFEFIRRKED